MTGKKDPQQLGRRERQILDIVFRLGEASVGGVRAEMPDPPAYDSVRTMIRVLERKGFLKHRREGTKYVYCPTKSREKVSRSAIAHLMKTFFAGSATDAMAAMLDVAAEEITENDLDRMTQLIDEARNEGR